MPVKMGNKFLYLLGAGASCNALPLVANMSKSFRDFVPVLATLRVGDEHKSIIKELIIDIKWLADTSEQYDSVDTLAKFYYLNQDQDNLNRLKRTLALYFLIEQFYFNAFDKRYLVFLTSIMEKHVMMPENVKILTWNYDYQMQMASSKFTKNKDFIRYFPTMKEEIPDIAFEHDPDIDLLNLNGIAGYHVIFKGEHPRRHLIVSKISNELGKILTFYTDIQENKPLELITFAWENPYKVRISHDAIIKKFATGVQYLIVIGYSFPFFNRKIDQKIFEALENRPLKIYYQNTDPERDGNELRSQFNLDHVDIEPIKYGNRFFIPTEL